MAAGVLSGKVGANGQLGVALWWARLIAVRLGFLVAAVAWIWCQWVASRS
ncbi:hypothetical protein [Mycobacterium leprae]|nr:hypothetical protein [Mycobacterium leprae]